MREDLYNVLEVKNDNDPGNYLGVPVLWGRSKCEALSFVRDKVVKKVQGWNSSRKWEERFLSHPNEIPMYPMTIFKFPRRFVKI